MAGISADEFFTHRLKQNCNACVVVVVPGTSPSKAHQFREGGRGRGVMGKPPLLTTTYSMYSSSS
jgi:hypothetical protein